MAGQHQNRAFDATLAHAAAQFAAIGIRQAHVQDDKVIRPGLGLFHAVGTVCGLEHIEILGHHKLFAQGFTQVIVIVNQQDFAQCGHNRLLGFVLGNRCVRGPCGDLRMGVPVVLTGGGQAAVVVAVEMLSAARLDAMRALGRPELALTLHRAETLKARAYDGDLARMAVPGDVGLAWLRALADPKDDLATPMKGRMS